MKDITLRGSDIRRELTIWGVLLVVSLLVNLVAIVAYDGAWSELFTQLPVVVALSVVLYLLQALVRGIAQGARIMLSYLAKRTATGDSNPENNL